MAKARKKRVGKRPCPKGKRRVGKRCMQAAGRYLAKWCSRGPVIQSGKNRGKCPTARQAAARNKRKGGPRPYTKSESAARAPSAAQVRAAERKADMLLLKRAKLAAIRATRRR